jgi:hypothetical protein
MTQYLLQKEKAMLNYDEIKTMTITDIVRLIGDLRNVITQQQEELDEMASKNDCASS